MFMLQHRRQAAGDWPLCEPHACYPTVITGAEIRWELEWKKITWTPGFWFGRDELARLCNRVHVAGWRVRCVIERYGERSRWRSGLYRVQRGCGPIKGFYRCPVREFSPVFLLSGKNRKKTRNYHRRIVCENDREVFRGHVARVRCRDATLPDATTVLSTAQGRLPILFIYLNMCNKSTFCFYRFVLIICYSIKITSSININYE